MKTKSSRQTNQTGRAAGGLALPPSPEEAAELADAACKQMGMKGHAAKRLKEAAQSTALGGGAAPQPRAWRDVKQGMDPRGYLVAEFSGRGVGVLTVDYDRVFDGSDDWLTFDVIGVPDGSECARYGASQIDMTPDLRGRIVSMAVKYLCRLTADQLDEDNRDGCPQMQAYICATSFVDGNDDMGEFANSLLPWLEECDGDSDGLNVPQFKRLASEAAKVWKNHRAG